MEKEHQPDSMATITMKPEYPPSEVYSTSEPPPAYRQRASNSVQIARIAAVTVVAASVILGAFILASSWVAARASCHQLEQLDAMLDKELALEGKNYGNDAFMADEPLPLSNAHALQGVPPPSSSAAPAPAAHTKDDALNHAESKYDEEKLQKIDDDRKSSDSSESSESDSSGEEEDELDGIRSLMKLPLQFDLDELAGLLANNNLKSRMNCVVERRHGDPMERRFPFNILGAFAPRAPRAERIAIICHGGDEPRPMNFPEPQSQVFAFPLSGPVRLPLRPQPSGPAPPGGPAPPAPEPRAPFAPMQHRAQPFPLPLPWDSSEEQMAPPREMRIHVQRVIAIPAPHNMPPPENMPFAPPPLPQQQNREQTEQATVLHQFVPQPAPTQELEQPEVQKLQMDGSPSGGNLPWGLTPEDLRVIQRTAEEAHAQAPRRDSQQQIDNDMQEMGLFQVKTIVNTLAAAAEAEAAAAAEAEAEAGAGGQRDSPRAPRTLLLPQEMPMEERPHYMQPRSVRSVDAPKPLAERCNCNCR